MTAAEVTGWLDRLAEMHKAAVVQRHNYPSLPWLRVDPEDGSVVEAVWSDGGHMPYVDCFDHESAASIVAAHNALPQLVAAVRGVLALHEPAHPEGPTSCVECNKGRKFVPWPCPTVTAVAAALGAEVAGR